MNKITSFVFGAAIGCAAGSIAALALTPRTGEENRKMAVELANQAAEKVKGVQGEPPMGEDELRAKIEEARNRIAERMAAEAQAGKPDSVEIK